MVNVRQGEKGLQGPGYYQQFVCPSSDVITGKPFHAISKKTMKAPCSELSEISRTVSVLQQSLPRRNALNRHTREYKNYLSAP